MSVRLHIDSWDPSYGTGLDSAEVGPAEQSTAQLGLDVELPAAAWRALAAPADLRAPGVVLLVDGVRRVDARVWVEETTAPAGGPARAALPGLAASYAAGAVRCDLRRGSAEVAATRIARGLFTASPAATDVATAHTRYPVRRVAASEPGQLLATQLLVEVQQHLHDLEVGVAAEVRAATVDSTAADDDLLVIDGPLRGRTQLPRALGYVKTHRVQYLPPALAALVGRLRPGQRSPVFLLGTSWHRYSWYLRLPGPAGSPWAGVVRVEAAAELARGAAIRFADLSAVTLPRFASTPYKDARAPQNLTPIAGLERRLRALLGDQRLLLRSLAAAAARPAPAISAASSGAIAATARTAA